MAKHALLSASGAHRWLECTPSALLELQFPQTTSEYAEEGTAAHELCELTARYFLGEVSEMDFENRRDELAKGPYYNAEMQECANDYARFVAEKTKAAQESCEDAFTELEVRVDFSKYVKDGFGTGDCIIVADKVLEIVDFKYGKGVRVEATGNPQMKLYALGALLKYNTLFDINSVRMTIFQPRLSGVQSSDEITVKELLEWAEKYVKPRATARRKPKTKSSSVRSTGLIYTMIQRRTENMLESVLQNLINIGWAMLIFLAAYLANVAFSLWYNIKILHESFDKDKLIASGLKILTFVVGLTLLCTAITTLPLFANQVGWAIPEEYSDLFADLIIIGAVLLVACKYIKEAFTKFVAILNTKTEGGIENE